jgi:protoheme ferro-lyase
MSFHGVPERTLHLGDPYHCESLKTGRLLAERLGLRKDHYQITFQSRFGKAKWLEPYTQPTIEALARRAPGAWTWCAPASPATAWRRWKKSTWKCARRFCTQAARSFITSPA